MTLEKYKKKRKFTKTPEPEGKKLSGKGPLVFVIQKHEASRLHYDFRLEMDGVLKSWAIPKGPSLNPEDKRLAMMVEDHPIEYANFEGIIPKGNYGAGSVMVWDNGVYSPYQTVDRDEAEKILLEQLGKGHLTFILLGKKLKGEFALVRSPNAGENAWLLIKKGDEYASKVDILKEDKSVVSERSMEEIEKQAESKNEIWLGKPKNIDLDEAPKEKFPEKLKPMLATLVDEPFDRKNWIFEVKWDGYRTLSEVRSGKVELYSRNLLSFNEKFSEIRESLKKFPADAVLDGEVVVLDEAGRPRFQLIQDYPSSKGELVYYVFDILHYDGHNTRALPLSERKKILREVLPNLPRVVYSDHIEEDGVNFFKETQKLNIEGIIAKDSMSQYTPGYRSRSWLNIKTSMRQEAVIAGFTKPRGGRKYFGSLVLGVYKNKKLKYIGHSGGGFDDKTLENVYKKLKPLEQEENPFGEPIKTNMPVTWVKPELLAEIGFSEWTNEGLMRHPIFLGLRDDKPAKEVKEEKPLEPSNDDIETTINGQNLKLTNLTKVFWPKEGYRKGDLIMYYKEISDLILPYLKDRPQSLLRFPNGIEGESFFQKNTSNMVADWIEKVTIRSEGEKREIEYMLCQDEAALIYMINLGCIDINPWNSRVKHFENPDYLIIDLDPEDVGFEKVVETAIAVNDVLEELEIKGYPKTSGAKGIHIYIPMGAKYDYDQVKNFAELLCLRVQKKKPEITSMERSPKKRQKKVYLDYLQNRRGQTLASVYSIRAKPGATVSTPLEWKEVNNKLTPQMFTIKNIMNRIQKKGDLFKPILGKGIDMEKILNALR